MAMSSLHLIDKDGNLENDGILNFLLETTDRTPGDLHLIGINYHVVCIFGGQSSGKSTLLNELFGTSFQMLNSKVRRGQTTQGAFLGTPSPELNQDRSTSSPLLIMDLEGTDGIERGEDQSFERQLSLFGLSVADTLIINMWAVDVGRMNASNLSLLRTIFEVNLHLFSHDGYEKNEKPTLLVVLRDFTEENTAPMLDTVKASFDTIWDGIKKPERFVAANFDDFFLLRCITLPHYKLQKELFDAEVAKLRRCFLSPDDENYFFPQGGMLRSVPVEGFPAYVSSCWKTIRTSKELDIPTQREMLAQHRCKEVLGQQVDLFKKETEALTAELEEGNVISNVVARLQELVEKCTSGFKELTRLYRESVVELYFSKLRSELLLEVTNTIEAYSKRISIEIMGVVETQAYNILDSALDVLALTGQECALLDSDGADDKHSIANQPRNIDNGACRKAIGTFWRTLNERIQKLLDNVEHSTPSVDLFGRYSAVVESEPLLRSMTATAVMRDVVERLKSRFMSMSSHASETLHRIFEKGLTHKPDGQIRLVRSSKMLETLTPGAVQGALFVLGALIYFRLDVRPAEVEKKSEGANKLDVLSLEDVVKSRKVRLVMRENDEEQNFFLRFGSIHHPPVYPSCASVVTGTAEVGGREAVHQSCVLLSSSAVSQAFSQFNDRVNFTVQSKMQMIEATKQSLPAWVLPALFILGFNEMMYVLTSPLLLIILIVFLVVFARERIINFWEDFKETGPPYVVVPLNMMIQKSRSLLGAQMGDEGRPVGESNRRRKVKMD